MKKVNLNSHLMFQWEEKQNCYVILYPEGMVQLNDSAGEILALCNGSKNVEEINQALCDKFKVKDLKNDIEAFLDEAENRKWICYE